MEDIKQAYEQLGLEPFASKDDVEKRYSTLLRKDRARAKLGESASDDPDFDFAQITIAYRAILDYETKQYTEAFEEKEYGKYKKMAGQAKKFDHFWRYYKVHTFAAIFVVIAIIYGVFAFMEKQEEKRYLASLPPIDLKVSFLGNFFDMSEDETFATTNAKLLADFPQFQRVETNMIYVPEDPSMQHAYLQKAMVMIMTEKPDIYIIDEPMMNWAGSQGVFVSLEEFSSLAELKETPYAVRTTIKNGEIIEAEDQFTAVDLSESKLAEELPIAFTKLYVGIRVDAEHPETALAFIEKYAATLPLQ